MNYRALMFGVVLVLLASCGKPKTNFSDPENQIVRKLSSNRIVMLGDFAHEFPLVHHTLISTLTTWLSMLEKGETDLNRLTLFLEEDNHVALLIRQYLKTGDLNPLLDVLLPGTSIERLEFYANLRHITTRIDSMNEFLPSPKKIIFDVQGPEEMNYLDPRALDMSTRDGLLFYAKERDSLAAGHIITYFRAHPNQRALVFYGNGHLIRNIMEKTEFTGQLTSAERTGAYMAFYLKREFGDGQVFTISQVPSNIPGLKSVETDQADRMYLSPDLPWKDLASGDENLDPKNFDAFIVRHEYLVRSHSLQTVLSKRIAEAALRRLESMEPHRSGVFGNRHYQQALGTLASLYDTTWTTAADWKSWCETHPFGGFQKLQLDATRKGLGDKCSDALGTPRFSGYIDDLIDRGFDPRVGSLTMTRQEWERDFDQMWPQIVFLNAIGILFVGTPDELAEVKSYLVKKSGQNYDDPALYLQWWRKNYYDVTY